MTRYRVKQWEDIKKSLIENGYEIDCESKFGDWVHIQNEKRSFLNDMKQCIGEEVDENNVAGAWVFSKEWLEPIEEEEEVLAGLQTRDNLLAELNRMQQEDTISFLKHKITMLENNLDIVKNRNIELTAKLFELGSFAEINTKLVEDLKKLREEK